MPARNALAAAVLGLAFLAPSAQAGTPCADLHGGFETDIYATGIGCPDARAVVRKWHRKAVTQGQGPGDKYVGDFACRSFPEGDQHVNVRCADGKRKIRFFAGP